MQLTPLVCAPLLVLVGLLPQQGQGQGPGHGGKKKKNAPAAAPVAEEAPGPKVLAWDPVFDYTNLQPSNEDYWKPLVAVQVKLEDAILFAHKSEGDFQVGNANLVTGAAGSYWSLELFEGTGPKPKRVDLQVSAAEPKVLKRIELLALAPADEQTWALLSQVKLPLETALVMGIQAVKGDKAEAAVPDGRVRYAKFLPTPAATPLWIFEVMGNEVAKSQLRRYELQVDPSKEKEAIKRRTLLDRFPGEPLRKGVPTQGANGMWTYDFKEGDGEEVKPDSKVKVNYRLFLLDGQKAYDTWEKKLPETFEVAKAPLKGITAGLPGMRVGGRRKLAMPYALAFGENGNALAPPKAMVVCDISVEELVSQ